MEFNSKIDSELQIRKKQKLIRELISTEKSFLNHLDLIIEVY